MGYKQSVKGAIILDLNTKTIFISRNVTYHEYILPYWNPNQPFHWTYHSNHLIVSDVETEPYATNEYEHDHHIEILDQEINPIISNTHEHILQHEMNENQLPNEKYINLKT